MRRRRLLPLALIGLLVVACAHVGASAVTTIGIWLVERAGAGGVALAYPIDVGVSYTLAGAAGALAWRLPWAARAVWIAAAVGAFGLWRVVTGPTFTDVGHLCALVIGAVVGLAVAPRPAPAAGGSPAGPRPWSQHAVARALSGAPRMTGEDGSRRRARRLLVAAATVACAALGVLTFVSLISEPIDPAKGSVTVLGRIDEVSECGPACAEVTVGYGAAGATKTATIVETSDRPPRPGARMLLRVDADGTAHPVLGRTPAKIDATGFFAVATVISGLLAAGALADGRRRQPRAGAPDARERPRAAAGRAG